MGTWGAAGLEVWSRDAEAARRPVERFARVEGLADSRAERSESRQTSVRSEAFEDAGSKPEMSSRRFENAVWRLMQKEKRTTWNDECLRKAVETIGKEIDFNGLSPARKKEVEAYQLPEPLGGPTVSRKRRSLDSRAASLPTATAGSLEVQRLENAVWRLWPREQRAWQPWYSVPQEGEKATEELGLQIDFHRVQRLLHKQDVMSQFKMQLVKRACSIEASTGTPATPRSLLSWEEEEKEEKAEEQVTSGWMDAAFPAACAVGVLMALGALRAVKAA